MCAATPEPSVMYEAQRQQSAACPNGSVLRIARTGVRTCLGVMGLMV